MEFVTKIPPGGTAPFIIKQLIKKQANIVRTLYEFQATPTAIWRAMKMTLLLPILPLL